jgi:hypothetical protein
LNVSVAHLLRGYRAVLLKDFLIPVIELDIANKNTGATCGEGGLSFLGASISGPSPNTDCCQVGTRAFRSMTWHSSMHLARKAQQFIL